LNEHLLGLPWLQIIRWLAAKYHQPTQFIFSRENAAFPGSLIFVMWELI